MEKRPPMNPSTVFLGESDDKGVFPNILPNKYALISLQITKLAGNINLKLNKSYQTRPLNMLDTIKEEDTPKINRII